MGTFKAFLKALLQKNMATKNLKKRNSGKPRHRQAKSSSTSLQQQALTKTQKASATWFGHLLPAEHPGPFSPLIITLLLGLLVVLSYLPALQAGFVWDDAILARAEPLHSLSGLWQIWFEPGSLQKVEGHYWPALYTTFWLEYQLWGLAPLGYHIVNLMLHLLATLLLWRLLLRLAVPGAWMVAMIFAVHPLHVESVAWVIGRKDVLAAVFSMASALAYLRFVADKRFRDYGWTLGFLVLGMLSKSVTVALPLTFLIWHWCQQGRVTQGDLMKVLPLLLVVGSMAFADWSYYKGLEVLFFDYSLVERALIAAQALWFYLGKLLWPIDLAVIYPIWDINVADPLGWVYLLAAVLVAVLLWHFRHRIGRYPLAGALFFVITLSPVLGFIDYGFMQFSLVADRYQYLAGVGVMATLVGAATHWLGKLSDNLLDNQSNTWRRRAPILMVIPLIILATLTWQQASIYRNLGTFYEHIIALNPQARHAHYNLGNYLKDEGRTEEALAAYRIALEKDPDFANVLVNIGVIFYNQNQHEQAEKYYRLALEKDPLSVRTRANLAHMLVSQGRYEEASKLYRSIIKTDAKHAAAYHGLGIIYANTNKLEEALDNFNYALLLDPSKKKVRDNRAKVLKIIQEQQ